MTIYDVEGSFTCLFSLENMLYTIIYHYLKILPLKVCFTSNVLVLNKTAAAL